MTTQLNRKSVLLIALVAVTLAISLTLVTVRSRAANNAKTVVAQTTASLSWLRVPGGWNLSRKTFRLAPS